MTDADEFRPGQVVWYDLTVPNAEEVRDFYAEVVGWDPVDHPMDDYADYEMQHPETGETVAGVCHARGENADIPPEWMLYVAVADLDTSLDACRQRGGTVLRERRPAESAASAIIEDPGGATITLYETPE